MPQKVFSTGTSYPQLLLFLLLLFINIFSQIHRTEVGMHIWTLSGPKPCSEQCQGAWLLRVVSCPAEC